MRSTECLDCVEKMIEAASAQGINGVPFVIIDGKWAVNGRQPVECFIQVSYSINFCSDMITYEYTLLYFP